MTDAVQTETELNERQQKFCQEFVFGAHQGNATRSYLVVYRESSVTSAGTCASQLLKDPRSSRYLAELRRDAHEKRLRELQPWSSLVGEAQAILLAILRGEVRSRLMLDACRDVLDRSLGKAPQRLEHEFAFDEHEVNRALMALAHRQLADGSRATEAVG